MNFHHNLFLFNFRNDFVPKYKNTTRENFLLSTENIAIQFTDDGIQRIAELAWQVNEKGKESLTASPGCHSRSITRKSLACAKMGW